MNYLGHLLVLPDSGLITLGNLLGDFFKGRLDTIPDPELRLGVALHRELDRFTAQHPIVRTAISRISPARHRVAGVLVDDFIDHFLIPGVALPPLEESLRPHVHRLPEALRPLPARMISSGWFGAYASTVGIGQVLRRMEQRRGRTMGLDGAEAELIAHYDAFASDVQAFFPEAASFTREALLRLQSASPAALPPAAAAESLSGHPQTS